MKTIKQMYDDLNNELIQKIKAGDFNITKIEKHVVSIEAGELQASLWISDDDCINMEIEDIHKMIDLMKRKL